MWNKAINTIGRWLDQLDSEHWFIVLIVVLVIGTMCLRGFGSRKHY